MDWLKKRNIDDMPWYRNRSYKGNFSEEEKFKLDSIRSDAKSKFHPASKFEDLADEVQLYISKLEVEAQQSENSQYFVALFIGVGMIVYRVAVFLEFFKYGYIIPSIYVFIIVSSIFIIFGVLGLKHVSLKYEKNVIDMELLKNWEVDYILNQRKQSIIGEDR